MPNEVAAVELDNQAFECRVIRHLARQMLNCHRVFKERDRKIDGQFDVAVFRDEIAPIFDRPRRDEGRQRAEMRIGLVRNEIGRR